MAKTKLKKYFLSFYFCNSPRVFCSANIYSSTRRKQEVVPLNTAANINDEYFLGLFIFNYTVAICRTLTFKHSSCVEGYFFLELFSWLYWCLWVSNWRLGYRFFVIRNPAPFNGWEWLLNCLELDWPNYNFNVFVLWFAI